MRTRLAEEELVCPPAVALCIARELSKSVEQCFEHGLCPEVLPLTSITISPRGEIVVRPSSGVAKSERDAIVAMAHALTAFASPSPAIDPLCRALYGITTFQAARERIEIEADRSGFVVETHALVRMLEYLASQPKRTLSELPLFERAPALSSDDLIAVHEPARIDRRPNPQNDEVDPNQWFLRVVPKKLRYTPTRTNDR
ncbi:MAG: hypothetical protein IT381_21780 [Deltaproteobacteria bacterium]|nr:hypothetical protein [Deltaproteobacteria bacterium]